MLSDVHSIFFSLVCCRDQFTQFQFHVRAQWSPHLPHSSCSLLFPEAVVLQWTLRFYFHAVVFFWKSFTDARSECSVVVLFFLSLFFLKKIFFGLLIVVFSVYLCSACDLPGRLCGSMHRDARFGPRGRRRESKNTPSGRRVSPEWIGMCVLGCDVVIIFVTLAYWCEGLPQLKTVIATGRWDEVHQKKRRLPGFTPSVAGVSQPVTKATVDTVVREESENLFLTFTVELKVYLVRNILTSRFVLFNRLTNLSMSGDCDHCQLSDF